jgi:ATP-dependent Clp protease ATP-binding subunit ClpC
MPESTFQESNLIFQPGLNLLRIFQRRLRVILAGLVYLLLILFGLYGVLVLFLFPESLDIFYLSLLTDMFLFYLWQRRKEKIRKIKPSPAVLLSVDEANGFTLLQDRPGETIEISLFLDKAAQKSLERAWLFCYQKGYHFLRPIHLFAAFLKNKDFKKVLKRLNCQPKQITEKTKNILERASFFPEADKKGSILGPKITADFQKIFLDAYLFCLKEGREQIGYLDILWAVSQQRNLVGMIFDEFGIGPEEIKRVIEWSQLEEKIRQREKSFFWQRLFKPKGKLDRAMIAAATPLLDRVSQDLTHLARQGQFEMVVGREKEIEEIFNFFSTGRVGIVLVGQSEIGKRAILKKLAQMMVEEKVPRFLQDKRLVKLDLGSLVSLGEARQRGEEYLRRILLEVNRAGNIILVIEDIDNLVGLKSQPTGLDFAEILAAALDRRAFFLISTTSPEGFSSKIEGKILGRVLNKIQVALPSRDLLWQILITKIFIIEKELKVLFSVDALEQAIDLADRYLYGPALPVKVLGLLEEAAALARSQRGRGSLIKGSDIVELVVKRTSIPLGQIQETEKEKLLQLEKLIHQRVINQEEAVTAVAAALRRSRLQLREQKKPICNFLFIGPTGVGKTELAKTLARVYFGHQQRMIRLDMSEYQEKRGLRRLIGLRTDEGVTKGYLTETIKRQPYSLLLLDEIEKAHPDILNLFLQVMDDGRLTDASGETINFTNVILIATSNAGTQFIQEKISLGFSYEEIYRQLKEKVLLDYFRPEFLNRFDKIVLFKSLSMENMIKITQLFLREVQEGLKEKGVGLEVTAEAVKELAQAGFDPLYGARPLRRVIQEKVEDTLARLFLENRVKRRDKLILKKGLVFEIEPAPEI